MVGGQRPDSEYGCPPAPLSSSIPYGASCMHVDQFQCRPDRDLGETRRTPQFDWFCSSCAMDGTCYSFHSTARPGGLRATGILSSTCSPYVLRLHEKNEASNSMSLPLFTSAIHQSIKEGPSVFSNTPPRQTLRQTGWASFRCRSRGHPPTCRGR